MPGKDDAITTNNVRDKGFHWEDPPLVFINGCHTAALEPEHALNFVSAFVEATYASGVIGTEVTVFEPLATWFAQEFFIRFVAKGQPVGQAFRGARLALLKEGNPLGLVYVPFVAPDMTLRRKETSPTA